jgi:alanine racemase
MIDVSEVPNSSVGQAVVLWGRGLGAEEIAASADTISYELVARVGPRVERRYHQS